MAGFEDQYYQVPSDSVDTRPVTSRRSLKIAAALFSGSCLVCLCVVATSVSSTTSYGARAIMPMNLISSTSLVTGRGSARLQDSSIYRHGMASFSQSPSHQPNWLSGVERGTAEGTTDALVGRDVGVAKHTPMAKRGWARNVRAFGEYGASSTSFYTDAEKQDSYDDLDKVLDAKMADPQVKAVIKEMLGAIADITEALRSALVTVEGSSNTFGDQQLSVDVIADEIMWNACKASKTVKFGASEEEPEVKMTNPNGEFTVCWDPLDGSSIVDNNWAVGTMIGIWGSKSGTGEDGLIGATGREQVTSLVALYGPRTTVLVALDDGVYEFSYGCTPEGCELPDGTFAPWICSRKQIKISEDCKIFAPANMRAAKELEGYKKLIEHYMENKFTLRYTGGLVPDVYQQFTKQQGVFSNPTSPSSPAKLRLAFEASPFGLLVEKAGGKTSDGVTGGSILDVPIKKVDQRTALCIGSSNEVDRFNDLICMVGGKGKGTQIPKNQAGLGVDEAMR